MFTIKDLLTEHFLEWQSQSGDIKKQGEFAAYIGESEKYLSMLMNGRKASERQIHHFAEFFHDERFYDAADMPRPDPRLLYVQRNWGRISEIGKERIAEEAAKYVPDEAHQNK